jgi:hypothetical protein
VGLGACELLRGNFDSARDRFLQALRAFPVLFELRYQIGLAWFREKKERKAREEFLLCLKMDDEPLFQRLERLRERSRSAKSKN